MRMDHAISGRPRHWLAITLAVLSVSILAACGTASQTEPPIPDATAGVRVMPAPTNDSQPAAEAAPTDEKHISLPIANRATTATRTDLRVTQGDTVRLTFTADEPGEIHLHGYDLTADVSPGHPGELVFEATTAGAFGINFHVFAGERASASDAADDGHHHDESATIVSEIPISVSITAEPAERGGVDVSIATEGFRFAEELVDQPHEPGVGHAHIYLNGEKLARVFESHYHIADLAPGRNVIRVSLNANDHSELIYNGAIVDSTAIVIVPETAQSGDDDHGDDDDGHGGHEHDGHDHDASVEIVAEVHLGNLEVYP